MCVHVYALYSNTVCMCEHKHTCRPNSGRLINARPAVSVANKVKPVYNGQPAC